MILVTGGTASPGRVVAGGSATGGVATGGIVARGSATDGIATGGIVAGGIASTGGITSGGVATGGGPSGGIATGGITSGGAATGGGPSGRIATGGVVAGGIASTGGIISGGVATGGGPGGRIATGGIASTGGITTGGVIAGGVASGGVASGGIATGGSSCVLGAFGAPEKITGLGLSLNLYSPSLSSDGLTLYLSASKTGQPDHIYVATRADRGAQFAVATAVTSINSSSADGTPFLSYDGLTLCVSDGGACGTLGGPCCGGTGAEGLAWSTITAKHRPCAEFRRWRVQGIMAPRAWRTLRSIVRATQEQVKNRPVSDETHVQPMYPLHKVLGAGRAGDAT